jgi:pyrroline-5-carboxylate reductase
MRVGFVGAGNMATGLARGWALAKDEQGAPEALLFADADSEKAQAAAEEVGGKAVKGNRALADAADLVVLAVKPNMLGQVAQELEGAQKPIVSILAGTTLQKLQGALPGAKLIRVMPNLGAQLRQGVFCVAAAPNADGELKQQVNELLGLLGDVIELDEELIDPATAIMGCTPGYLALMAEVLVEEGVKLGLSEDDSKRMAARAMAATGGLLNEQEPAALKQAVASPGGMTEAGLDALEDKQFRETLRAAVDASMERVRGMGK